MLPNSPNVLMAAERAAELSDKTVVVVPDALAAGRARRRGRARPRRAAPPRTPRRCTRRSRSCAPARSPRPRATTPSAARRASAAATRSASSTSGSSPGASRPRRSRPCSASSAARPSCVTLIAGDGRAARRRRASRRWRPTGVELEYSWGGQPALLVADRRRVAESRAARARVSAARARMMGACLTPRRLRFIRAAGRRTSCAPTAGRGCRARRGSPRRSRSTPRRPRRAPSGSACDTVGDLLEHLPRDRSEARTIAELGAGEVATVVVEVRSITSRPVRRRGHEAARRGDRRRRDRRDEGDVLQPAVAASASTARARG